MGDVLYTDDDEQVDVEEGDRLYNHGDMANQSHFGTVVDVEEGRFGTSVTIQPDEDGPRDGEYEISLALIDEEFEGHSGTRVVPEMEYYRYRVRRILKMNDLEPTEQEVDELAERMKEKGSLEKGDVEEVTG